MARVLKFHLSNVWSYRFTGVFTLPLSCRYAQEWVFAISIEYLHLTKFEKKNMINHLIKKNYSYCGFGYDHNNFDYIFKKKKIFTNVILSKLIWLISTKHYKIINYFLRDKINWQLLKKGTKNWSFWNSLGSYLPKSYANLHLLKFFITNFISEPD